MIIHRCEQGSPEWHKLRGSRITATGFAKVMAKGGGKTRGDYMQGILDYRQGRPVDPAFCNDIMQEGSNREVEALSLYAHIRRVTATPVGFVEMDEWVGVSPDALVDIDGLVEVKNPLWTTHNKYVAVGTLPAIYKPQVQGQMWVCEKQWCDFVSYCPDIKCDKPLLIHRVKRDEKYIDGLRWEVDKFIKELKEKLGE